MRCNQCEDIENVNTSSEGSREEVVPPTREEVDMLGLLLRECLDHNPAANPNRIADGLDFCCVLSGALSLCISTGLCIQLAINHLNVLFWCYHYEELPQHYTLQWFLFDLVIILLHGVMVLGMPSIISVISIRRFKTLYSYHFGIELSLQFFRIAAFAFLWSYNGLLRSTLASIRTPCATYSLLGVVQLLVAHVSLSKDYLDMSIVGVTLVEVFLKIAPVISSLCIGYLYLTGPPQIYGTSKLA